MKLLIFNIFNPSMKLTINDQKTGGNLLLISGEQDFDQLFYTRDKHRKYFTITWNYGEKQTAKTLANIVASIS